MPRCICCREELKFSAIDNAYLCTNTACPELELFVSKCKLSVDSLLVEKDQRIAEYEAELNNLMDDFYNMDDEIGSKWAWIRAERIKKLQYRS